MDDETLEQFMAFHFGPNAALSESDRVIAERVWAQSRERRRLNATPPAPVPGMGKREAFEAEAKRWGLSTAKHSKDVGPYRAGDYADSRTNIAWHFWQAALSTPSPSPSEEERRALRMSIRILSDYGFRGAAAGLIAIRDRLVKEGK